MTGTVTLTPLYFLEQRHYHLRWIAPEGVTVACCGSLYTNRPGSPRKDKASAAFSLAAEGPVGARVELILEITSDGRPTSLYLPVTVLG